MISCISLKFSKEIRLRQKNDNFLSKPYTMGFSLLLYVMRSGKKSSVLNDRSHPLRVIRFSINDFANHMSQTGNWFSNAAADNAQLTLVSHWQIQVQVQVRTNFCPFSCSLPGNFSLPSETFRIRYAGLEAWTRSWSGDFWYGYLLLNSISVFNCYQWWEIRLPNNLDLCG